MQEQLNPAEVWLEQEDVSLYGVIKSMNTQGATVRLDTLPEDAGILTPGAVADLTVIAKGAVCLSVTSVVSYQDGELVLLYSQPARRIQRRSSFRRPCRLVASYRHIGRDGSPAEWREGMAEDIGVGGCCLRLQDRGGEPDMVDLSIVVPERHPTVEDHGAPNTTSTTIHVRGRVTNVRLGAERERLAGVSFIEISTEDQFRLARFSGEHADHQDVA